MTLPLTRFADLVHLNTDRTTDPLAAGIERFVGLEHIEPENLHIRSWGNVVDGTTFTSTFKPGQVLFGKRRAYQRKVAVADFEGVCSSDIYVFESKDPNKLLPELLPFICQSEGFFEYAVKTSAGSLSPRTNWSHLANYEFPLPPVDEQRRIADLLWVADDAVQQNHNAITALERLQSSVSKQIFSWGVDKSGKIRNDKDDSIFYDTELGKLPVGWKVVGIKDFLVPDDGLKTGPFGSSLKKEMYTKSGYKIYGQEQVIAGDLSIGDYYISEEKFHQLHAFEVQSNDILMSLVGTAGKVLVVKEPFEKGIINPRLIRFRTNTGNAPVSFLRHLLLSPMVKQQLNKYGQGGTMDVLSGLTFKKLVLPMPDFNEQVLIGEMLDNLEAQLHSYYDHLERTTDVKKKMLLKMIG